MILILAAPRQETPAPSPTLIAATPVPTATGATTVQVTFTEDELTKFAAEALRESGQLSVTDPRVTLVPGQAILTGRTSVLGFSVPVRVVAAPIVVDGRPAARVELVEVGGLPAPENFRRSVEEAITEALRPERLGLRGEVTKITVGEGVLTIEAVVPRAATAGVDGVNGGANPPAG